ncbi:MAG: glycoside hydrolase family 3 protein [Anaerolineae bacterium]|nr:glycoside hydrolase family 3 protein [Anaerolineae bacterium]
MIEDRKIIVTNTTVNVGHKLLLGFVGTEPPPPILRWLASRPLGGFTLFRYRNVENPCQVRQLTTTLQQAAQAAGYPPLLIGADQEGGQLNALGPALTAFPGNMALGAVADPDLAFRVGLALGRECAALGVNVNYAPSCDVNSNPQNPVIGVRSFGEKPQLVGELAAAMAQGIQAAGVISAAKHFPGHGDTVSDSHHGIPVVVHDEKRLWDVELRPFRAAIAAGAKIVMTSHVGLPALHNGRVLPATLSPTIIQGLLRQKLAFQGVIVSDAMDMAAIHQGAGLADDVLRAVQAGVDMLLMTDDPTAQDTAYHALINGLETGAINRAEVNDSIQRILALKQWLAAQTQPELTVIGCEEHRRLAQEVANRSVTLVRDAAGLLPLRIPADGRIALILPTFQNLTPADTSASEKMTLGTALRRYHPCVDEYVIPQQPDESTISTFRERAGQYDLVIVGTIAASRQTEQAALVNVLLDTVVPLITVALRTPYDLAAYPRARTHICTYSIQEPAMRALAAALWGEIPFQGKLPVRIPD